LTILNFVCQKAKFKYTKELFTFYKASFMSQYKNSLTFMTYVIEAIKE